jgi:hypothetical protein
MGRVENNGLIAALIYQIEPETQQKKHISKTSASTNEQSKRLAATRDQSWLRLWIVDQGSKNSRIFIVAGAPKAGTVLRNGPLSSAIIGDSFNGPLGQRSLPMKMSLKQLLLFFCLPSPSLPSS